VALLPEGEDGITTGVFKRGNDPSFFFFPLSFKGEGVKGGG
jgi:hypothetical protein